MSKLEEPESLASARRHDRIVNVYKRIGLCTKCAAQLGYGHQLGFAEMADPKVADWFGGLGRPGAQVSVGPRRPCEKCLPLIEALPKPQPGGWRSLEGDPLSEREPFTCTRTPGLVVPLRRSQPEPATELFGGHSGRRSA